jgi:acyl carrier protein
MEVNKRVVEILKEKLCIDEIGSDDNLIDDIGADSLDIMELVMEMEREFGIQILDDEIDTNFKNNIFRGKGRGKPC